ncbi:MAG TPA: 2Fe-2S iron-sulfur cluster-binding protein [Spirochaetia bacterium]|nr:2Fe-2S iron-sulfur cluster-binding protein [Spirochaetia bacterium]
MNTSFILNGEVVSIDTNPDVLLVDILRNQFGLLGTRPGCTQGYCGTCSVLLNGRLTPSCMVPAFRATGSEIVTIEGFMQSQDFLDIEKGFEQAGMAPCRYCVSSKILTTQALLLETQSPQEQDIREVVFSVWCRCTSYSSFAEGIRASSEVRRRRSSGRS